MKVQVIETDYGERYLLLDRNYRVVGPVKRWLKFCDNCGRLLNTLRTYAY